MAINYYKIHVNSLFLDKEIVSKGVTLVVEN